MFERTLVVGDSGSGKTTVGEALATGLGVEHIDLDALFWTEPAWQTPPPEAFRARVAEALERSERWVLSGNYSVVHDLTWANADTVVWLDLPLHVTMARVFRRSWQRSRTGELLWGTNYERFWPQLKLWDPESSVVGHTLQSHGGRLRMLRDRQRDPAWGHLTWVHLRSAREVERWLATIRA